ncbi:MAG: hypothetical protein ABMB14_04915, partial [Myxococcota bacterium]
MIRRAGWFVVRRGLRLLAGPLVIAICGTLVFGLTEPGKILGAWGLGLLLWVPGTLIQFRVAFFPSPPDPGLVGDDGKPLSTRDLRAVMRSEVAEYVVGSLPPLWLAGWVASTIGSGWLGIGIALGLSVWLVARDTSAIVTLILHEASVDLSLGRDDRARWWLERLNRLPLGHRDHLGALLARARFRTGDLDGALAALDRIRNRRDWPVDVMRAQIAIGRDGTAPARTLAARLALDPAQGPLVEALRALADLYDHREAEVIARAEALRALPPGEARRQALLMLAAAQAGPDPAGARRTLDEAGIPVDRAVAVTWAWPPIAARLAVLSTTPPTSRR